MPPWLSSRNDQWVRTASLHFTSRAGVAAFQGRAGRPDMAWGSNFEALFCMRTQDFCKGEAQPRRGPHPAEGLATGKGLTLRNSPSRRETGPLMSPKDP